MVQVYTVTEDGRYAHYCHRCRRWWTCGTACLEETVQDCPWCTESDADALPGVELLEPPTRATLPGGHNHVRTPHNGAPGAV